MKLSDLTRTSRPSLRQLAPAHWHAAPPPPFSFLFLSSELCAATDPNPKPPLSLLLSCCF